MSYREPLTAEQKGWLASAAVTELMDGEECGRYVVNLTLEWCAERIDPELPPWEGKAAPVKRPYVLDLLPPEAVRWANQTLQAAMGEVGRYLRDCLPAELAVTDTGKRVRVDVRGQMPPRIPIIIEGMESPRRREGRRR